MTIDEIKARIEDRLEAMGSNPNAAAEAAGLHRDFIRNILRGKSKEPGAERLLKVARALKCRLEWLLTGEGPITDEWSGLSEGERLWLTAFQKLSKEQRLFVWTSLAPMAGLHQALPEGPMRAE